MVPTQRKYAKNVLKKFVLGEIPGFWAKRLKIEEE
jgi:hypothetical protein